ncbi:MULTISPECIES: energy-coupling factor transporter transmembrane component T [unclassified Corynebacterium]|uniref:energy-coupling factor transporter transmembrane component T n=1 Tax=unclassified Corynebacterium TaxID=2624378 RepID=UPI003F924294
MSPVSPLTPLTAAVCSIITAMVVHDPWVSAGFLLLAVVLTCAGGRRQRRALVAGLVLSAPAFLSYALIYVPFGDVEVARFLIPVTSDGAWIAWDLGLRFAAMTCAGLVLGSFVDADALMRRLQLSVPAPLVYMVGTVVRLLPIAQQRWRTIRQVQASRGVDVDTWRSRGATVLPLVVGLIDDASQRARPLQRTGIGEPGPRTLLMPVADSTVQQACRWLMVVAAVVVIVGGVFL